MHACVRDVFAIYDHDILPRLKMVIIKIVILYFIQIRHTDDFPSTGTRLVSIIVCTCWQLICATSSNPGNPYLVQFWKVRY